MASDTAVTDTVTTSSGSCCTLDKLITGKRVRVSAVKRNDLALYLKLVTMGIIPGSIIEVSQVAPLGDPIAIRTTGHNLSLRLSEAEMVEVDPSGARDVVMAGK